MVERRSGHRPGDFECSRCSASSNPATGAKYANILYPIKNADLVNSAGTSAQASVDSVADSIVSIAEVLAEQLKGGDTSGGYAVLAAIAAQLAEAAEAMQAAEALASSGGPTLDMIGVEAVDDRTFQITLEQPTPYFLELLTHQTGLASASGVR